MNIDTKLSDNFVALVVGATGITGSNLAGRLIEKGWTVYGLARAAKNENDAVISVSANLLNPEQLAEALKDIRPTHVFFTTWMRNATERENIRVNSAMVRNLLDVLSPKKSVLHVALVTGLKHYLGPFEAYAKDGFLPQTPLREEQPRLNIENFYYAQEDEVYAAAARDGFSWSIHRPHTVIGKAVGNAMNLGTTLAIYASICKELGKPFRWPGSDAQWNGISDVTDVRVLAEHLIWAATTETAKNEAFNIVNGDFFRWKWLWNKIAEYFEIDAIGYDGSIHPLEKELSAYDDKWQIIAEKYNLTEPNLKRLASAWHTDLDLGRPIEVMTDMSKSRKLGFHVYQSTYDSFTDLFTNLRAANLIP